MSLSNSSSLRMLDAKRSVQRDPTQTAGIRRAWRTDFNRRWKQVENATRDLLVVKDQWGLGTVNYGLADQGKIEQFQMWFDAVLETTVRGPDRGNWISLYLQRVLPLAAARATRLLGDNPTLHPMASSATLQAAAVVEMQGVMEAVSQQAVRAFADGVLMRRKPRDVARVIIEHIRKVGIERSHMLVDFATVRAHANATLDLFEAMGVRVVDVDPEFKPARLVVDTFDPNQPRDPAGTSTSGQWSSGLSEGMWPGKLSKYDQESGRVSSLVQKIEKRIGEKKIPDVSVITDPKNLLATQSWLSEEAGGGDPVFPDLEEGFGKYPVIARTGNGDRHIIDGHHTVYFAVLRGRSIKAFVFDLSLELQDAPPFGRVRQQRAVKAERKLERFFGAASVSVQTAGDDLVCPKCEQIEEDGPYTIDEARGLIPAHSRCRCSFVPVGGEGLGFGLQDRKRAYNPEQPRHPAGTEQGGEWSGDPSKENFAELARTPSGEWDPSHHQVLAEASLKFNLTKLEVAAIERYITTGYKGVNNSLRQEKSMGFADGVLMRRLDSALAKAKLPMDVEGWRAVSSDFYKELQNRSGQTFIDKGYTSISTSREAAEEFGGEASIEVLRVFMPKGSRVLPIAHISDNPDEREMLTARGSRFRVLKTPRGIDLYLEGNTHDAAPRELESADDERGDTNLGKFCWGAGDVEFEV